MLVRPITHADFPVLKALAESAGIGFTSLPPDDEVLHRRIERAVRSFSGEAERALTDYLFVLEMPSGEIGGCCAIAGAVGLDTPWYHYRMGLSVRHSKRLNTVSKMELMFLSNDLTGSSEVCTLLLAPAARGAGVGGFLSKSRFLFIADHRELFGEQFIAEMRGCLNEEGIPPFWEAVGKHFFKTDFLTVDRLSSSGDKSFISEMMLSHPLYVDMLPADVRATIGHVQPDTLPAIHLLKSEGFRQSPYVDIVDAGPVMLSETRHLRAVNESQVYTAKLLAGTAESSDEKKEKWMVSNCKLQDFRAIPIDRAPRGNLLEFTQEEMELLSVKEGDGVRAVSVYPKR